MKETIDRLKEIGDEGNAAFIAKLTPTVDPSLFLGVRMPQMRKFAKEYYPTDEAKRFLCELPHKYFDENMLHALLVCQIKDYEECIAEVDRFLPYVDNWAVCDCFSPKVFGKNRDKLLPKIGEWLNSDLTYTIRHGVNTLMGHFLDDDFNPAYLKLVANVKSDEYYVKMGVAWYFATALAKQWDSTIPYFEKPTLDKWTHNKSLQKARESLRVSDEQKEYLNSLKIKK